VIWGGHGAVYERTVTESSAQGTDCVVPLDDFPEIWPNLRPILRWWSGDWRFYSEDTTAEWIASFSAISRGAERTRRSISRAWLVPTLVPRLIPETDQLCSGERSVASQWDPHSASLAHHGNGNGNGNNDGSQREAGDGPRDPRGGLPWRCASYLQR
jgi:hypothetical protein